MLMFSFVSTQQLDQSSARLLNQRNGRANFHNGRLSILTAMQTCITVVSRPTSRLNLEHADVSRPLCHVIAETGNGL